MDVRKWLVGVLILGVCLASGSAFAVYTDITIPDLEGVGTGWYGAQEDNEVEPNCVQSQSWDMEAFMLDGTTLSLVGGWNFQTGVAGRPGGGNWESGDIFIDVNLDALYGPAAVNLPRDDNNNTVNLNFLYDYVLDVDWATGQYTAWSLLNTSTVQLSESYYGQNEEANPYRYVSGGGGPVATGQLTFGAWDNSATGFLGDGTHNAASVDLSWLGVLLPGYNPDPLATWSSDVMFHFTQQCGNDNLMGLGQFGGKGSENNVPEPATMVLMGLSLLGLAARKKLSLLV